VGLLCNAADAQTTWTGPTMTFTKADFADWTLPENQDRITDNVWITRADFQGIFNIKVEEQYDSATHSSPADTEWAFGSAADWQSLEFQTWFNWHGMNPLLVINEDAVVHLITDDIYIDITFLDWTPGPGGGGGGFVYERSTIPAPSGLLLFVLCGLRPTRRRR
jgi:hypothetical protein